MIRAGWATVSIFIGLILAALLPIATVYLDIVVLENGLPEVGVTETMQAVLLLASAVLFARKVRRNPKARGFLVLVTGFFQIGRASCRESVDLGGRSIIGIIIRVVVLGGLW